MKHRTFFYGLTRLMLAVGIVATAAVLLLARAQMQACFGCDYPDVLGLPANVVGAGLGVALALVGLVWMLRIFFRGRRGDQPPAWRYRDR